MTDITSAAPNASDWIGGFRRRRWPVALALVLLAIAPGEVGELTRGLITDAYVQVSAFVAATLILFYGAERLLKFDIGSSLRNARAAQVPIAALLGMTPGCGGAVVVVAAYTSGNVSFGSVVAALTATMGDAAFLLIATRPDAAAVVLPLSFVVGILTGYVVDAAHRNGFVSASAAGCELAPLIGRVQPRHIAYGLLALPGLVIGLTQILQYDIEAIYGPLPMVIALAGSAVGLWIWTRTPLTAMTNVADHPVTRMAEETSFISIWVIGAYLAYDYIATLGGVDVAAAFGGIAILLPLVGVLIGFIPGCGPQVLVTTLYINGIIPFGALIGNAIANDGDALFPAIALDPRAAIWATVYSAIPALIVGYGFLLLAPGFL